MNTDSVSAPESGFSPQRSVKSARRRWAMVVAAGVMLGIGLVLLFMLTTATNNQALYTTNYTLLLIINAVAALFLLAVIVWAVIRLALRLHRKKFGSRLLLKIAGIFALVGVVPGLLIYTVSYQFVSRSIESWFDVRVETALKAGVNLGQTTLDTLGSDVLARARQGAAQLGNVPDSAGAALTIERLREQWSATDVQLWSHHGKLLASTGQTRFELNPQRPAASLLRQVRSQRGLVQLEGLEDAGDRSNASLQPLTPAQWRVWVPVNNPGLGLTSEPRFLQVIQPMPPLLVADALAVQQAHREYQERALAREGLKRMYIGTLTLALFLAVFGAVLLAALLGNQLIRPLLLLAEGVRDVGRGDLRPKAIFTSKDELGGLTRAFADMTQQLADARHTAESSMAELDAARANLQTILDNLTAGVVVLDGAGQIDSVNPGASRILRVSMADYRGLPLTAVPGLEVLGQGVMQAFERPSLSPSAHAWQQSFEWTVGPDGPLCDTITIAARGADLPEGKRLLVFDDVSELVSAQRAKAWGEVARRLAHEIKNPLTPIQLSAERLAMKLDGKVAPSEQAILNKSVRTIIDQVDAMKRLVNEFRDYARLPSAHLQALDLNAFLREVVGLYDQAAVPVCLQLAPDCPPVLADAGQLRQVIHNLVQNAQDATPPVPLDEREEGLSGGCVVVKTVFWPQRKQVGLIVHDDGPGFADHILKRAFEPYVTTKAKGTGLGLAVVKKIVEEHGAHIELSNRKAAGVVQGGQVVVSLQVAN